MTNVSRRLWIFTRKFWIAMLSGALSGVILSWGATAYFSGPSVQVSDMFEAQGVQYRDNGSLDLALRIHRSRICPALTQRYAWRHVETNGVDSQQVVPIIDTVMPFFSDTENMVITVPTPDAVKAASDGNWYFRQVTIEECSLFPNWIMSLFGERIYRSPDIPLREVEQGQAGMIKLPIVTGPGAAGAKVPAAGGDKP